MVFSPPKGYGAPRRRSFATLAAAALAAMLVAAAAPAWALSEIKKEDLPPPPNQQPPAQTQSPVDSVPQPGPAQQPGGVDPNQTGPSGPATPPAGTPPADQPGAQQAEPEAPPPEVQYDVEKLPEPVRRMRQLILDACKSGDPEKLRPLIGMADDQTQLSLGDIDGDPITFLKGLSGDPDGLEILAILEEVLSAGYVHLDAGTAEDLYVWPYFFALPLDKLTAPQKVELFKLITAGDFEDMKNFGSYIFYRAGITPEGKWAFFVAGE